MPAAEARIETERAGRYLTQLCRHIQGIYAKRGLAGHARLARMAGHAQGRPPEPPQVEWTETHGRISIGDAVITLRADPGVLILRAEASSEGDLSRAQELVTRQLTTFGRRDQLSVTWQQAGVAS